MIASKTYYYKNYQPFAKTYSDHASIFDLYLKNKDVYIPT